MPYISINQFNKYSVKSIISDLLTNSLAECMFPPHGPKTDTGNFYSNSKKLEFSNATRYKLTIYIFVFVIVYFIY
jgi:hypothetical protein